MWELSAILNRSNKPMFQFKILAGDAQFDGPALGIAFALQAPLEELDEEREFMGGFEAEKLPWHGNNEGTAPLRGQAKRGRCLKKDAVFAFFEDRLDGARADLVQGNPGRVRQQKANGDGFRVSAQVKPQIEPVRAKSEEKLLPDAVALEHRGLLLGQVELARAEPVEVALGLPGNIGSKQAQRLGIAEIGAGQTNGDVEMRRRFDAEDAVDVLEVKPEELVEKEVGINGEVGAVPPEPVAALGGVDFPPGLLRGFLRDIPLGDALDQEVAGFLQPFPALIFLGIADPDIEITPDPRAGMQVAGLNLGGMRVEVIAKAAGF